MNEEDKTAVELDAAQTPVEYVCIYYMSSANDVYVYVYVYDIYSEVEAGETWVSI